MLARATKHTRQGPEAQRRSGCGLDLHLDRNCPAHSVGDRAMAKVPLRDLAKAFIRCVRGFDPNANADSERVRGHGPVHPEDAAIVRFAVHRDLHT